MTRCCVITGRGRGAVAVVAVHGPIAADAVDRCFRAVGQGALLAGQIRYGAWIGTSTSPLAAESVVVTPLQEGAFEIHCHGGPAATSRIVADLQDCGVRADDQQPWHDPHGDLLIDEARHVLMRCLTSRTAAIAMDQVRGAMRRWAEAQVLGVQRADRSLEQIRGEARELLRFAPLGLHLADPYRVVLVGPPNVGKSSLLNAIVGYDRSITFDGAGTTRDVLHAETVIDGWPIRLSDTAGIRDSSEPIEREGVQRAMAMADRADLLLCVSEPALLDSDADEPTQSLVRAAVDAGVPVIRVLNKSDLFLSPSGQSATDLGFDLLTNAVSGEGIDRLLDEIACRIGQPLPEPGWPVPVSARQANALQQLAAAATMEQTVDALHALMGSDPARPHGLG